MITRDVAASLAVLGLMLCRPAAADDDVGQHAGPAQPASQATAPAAPAGPQTPYSWGGFGITPLFLTGITYTDNVREDPSHVGDFRNDTSADLKIDAPAMDNAKLSLDSLVSQKSYLKYTEDDTTLFSFTGSGEYDFSKSLNFTSNLRYFQSQVSKSDPNAIPGAVQATVDTSYGNFQLNYDSSTWYDQVVINAQKLVYGAAFVPSSHEFVANSDQNRDEEDYDNHFGRKFDYLNFKTYLYLDYNEIHYESSEEASVAGRNSHGYKVGAGVGINPVPTFETHVFFAYARQEYDSPEVGNLNGWFGSAEMMWQIDPANAFALNFQRTFNETILPGSPGFFLNQLTIQYQHHFTLEWSADVAPLLIEADPSKIAATLQNYGGTVGANYTPVKWVTLRAQWMVARQHVDNPAFASLRYREDAATFQATVNF